MDMARRETGQILFGGRRIARSRQRESFHRRPRENAHRHRLPIGKDHLAHRRVDGQRNRRPLGRPATHLQQNHERQRSLLLRHIEKSKKDMVFKGVG